MMKMNAVALCGLIILAACQGPGISDQYPGPWTSALDNTDILRTMALNHIVGCEDKQYRTLGGREFEDMYREVHAGTYLVACSDGVVSKLYEVETRPGDDDKGIVKGPAKWPKDLPQPEFQTSVNH
jgi:hypothetical protein